MKRTGTDLERLKAELNSDIEDLALCLDKNERAAKRIASGAADELDYAALGYTIHGIYGLVENYCHRIARFFENGIDPATWHKDLLHRMTLSIPGIRPALFDRTALMLLDDLRAFRHVFRNLYARSLDPDRVLAVQNKVSPALVAFTSAHDTFISFLDRMKTLVD